MKRNNEIIITIDDKFFGKFLHQILNNKYLDLTVENANKASTVVLDYLTASPEERADTERAEEVIKILSTVFEQYSKSFIGIFNLLYEGMSTASDTERKISYGRGIALMLYQFCDYINGLSMKNTE